MRLPSASRAFASVANGMRNVPLNGSTTAPGRATSRPLDRSAICVIVKLPQIVPSGTRYRTAGDKSTSPLNVPLMTGRSGTWTELLPGALMTTSKLPLTGPVPSTVDTLSVPVAMTVQLLMRGTEIRSSDGHSGVPSSANPWSGEVAFLRITPGELGSGSNVTRSLISYSVTPLPPSESAGSSAWLAGGSTSSDT